ncbi:MAG: peptide deformylase [Roseobacter sp.]|jgi:peptide deformylase
MSVLDILRWPDPRLTTICDPVGKVTLDVEVLAQDMLDTMYAAPGRGLAAPQVGVLKRIFVMDCGWKDGEPDPIVFIDPGIVDASEQEAVSSEACLSVPGVTVDVTRPARVTVRWTDIAGKIREDTFSGFAAACVQHELDHLDGLLTLDRLGADDRARVLRDYDGVCA